jgi:hypothetical protein
MKTNATVADSRPELEWFVVPETLDCPPFAGFPKRSSPFVRTIGAIQS